MKLYLSAFLILFFVFGICGQINKSSLISSSREAITIAQKDVDNMAEEVGRARRQVAVAQTNVEMAEIEVKAAERELKRAQNLFESGVVSKLEVDMAENRLSNAKVAFGNAKSRFQSQEIAVQEAISKYNLAKAVERQKIAFYNNLVTSGQLNKVSPCGLLSNSLPSLRGLKLGMDISFLNKNFEIINKTQNEDGSKNGKIVFNDVTYYLTFANDKLSKLSALYKTREFQDASEFILTLNKTLNLPNLWHAEMIIDTEESSDISDSLATYSQLTQKRNELIQKRSELNKQLDDLLKDYKEKHPDVIAKRDEIGRVNDEIANLKQNANQIDNTAKQLTLQRRYFLVCSRFIMEAFLNKDHLPQINLSFNKKTQTRNFKL